MNFYKLALKNVIKNFKTYAIYTCTLIFAVALFYMFHCIFSQSGFLSIQNNIAFKMAQGEKVTFYMSIFFSIVLSVLVVIANHFFIKIRKKEFAIYLLMGMKRSTLLYLITLETLFLGVFSFALGIFIGVMVSQGMSLFVAKVLGEHLNDFYFVFSLEAVKKSLINFGIMFGFIAVFNATSLVKHNLLKLLKSQNESEKLPLPPFVALILFASALGLLWYCRSLFLSPNLFNLISNIGTVLLSGLVGTFLFYVSFLQVLQWLFSKAKGFYFKNDHAYVLRQLSSKVNTTFLSVSVVSICLFFATIIFSGGFAIGRFFDIGAKHFPYDLMLRYDDHSAFDDDNDLKVFKDNASLAFEMPYYSISDEMLGLQDLISTQNTIILLKDYNALMQALGKSSLELKETEYAIVPKTFTEIRDPSTAKGFVPISIDGKTLSKSHVDAKILPANARNNVYIVPLEHIDDVSEKYFLLLNYESKEASADALAQAKKIGVSYSSKLEFTQETGFARQLAFYIILYIGCVFLLGGSLIIALQQLLDVHAKKKNFVILRNIGFTDRQLRKTLALQIGIYFILPLIVCIYHSFTLKFFFDNVMTFLGSEDSSSIAVQGAMILLVVYAFYFVMTYVSSLKLLKQTKEESYGF